MVYSVSEDYNGRLFTIYALLDPATNEIKYIGKTNNPSKREKDHRGTKARTKKDLWIQSLKKEGKKPAFLTIEICEESKWYEREIYHIKKFNPPLNSHRWKTRRIKNDLRDVQQMLIDGTYYIHKSSGNFIVQLENGEYRMVYGSKGVDTKKGLYYIFIHKLRYNVPRESIIYSSEKKDLQILEGKQNDEGKFFTSKSKSKK